MSNAYADHLDAAAVLTEQRTSSAIDAIRNRPKPQASSECVDCGEPIPAARQQATGGTDHCIHCQSLLER